MASSPSSSNSHVALLLLAACCVVASTAVATPDYYPNPNPYPYPPVPAGFVPVPVPSPGSVLTVTANNADTTTIGQCLTGDKLLHVETVRKSSKWLQIRHQNVEYPAPGQQGGLISCVQLVSLKDRNNGSAVVQKGGPGHREVVVRVKSDRGHSVAWNVLVYGR